MTEKLLLITEEVSSPPYFLIVKLNNKMVFDTIGSNHALIFRSALKERLTRFSIESHESFRELNAHDSTMKFSNTDYLWICLNNKDFFDRLKTQLESINEMNLLGSLKSLEVDDIQKEELEKELNSIFSFCSLQKSLPSKQLVQKKIKI